MWHKITLSTHDLYKGWSIDIYPNSNYTKDLKVIISPGIKLNFNTMGFMTDHEKMELNWEFQRKRDKHSHSFIVKAPRTLLIFEFLTPWKKARQEAEAYVDRRLGRFDPNKF